MTRKKLDEPNDSADAPLSARRGQAKPGEASLSDSQRLQAVRLPADTPWMLRRFYEQQIDLGAELASRFASIPLMTVQRFRVLDAASGRGMATLAAADGVANILIESDPTTHLLHIACTYGSMLTLRFKLDNLSGRDRAHWLEQMRRQQDTVAFLWGQSRWEQDYLICVTRRQFVNLYAFSHNGFEAAARLTPEVKQTLLNWLETAWKPDLSSPDDTGKMLTW